MRVLRPTTTKGRGGTPLTEEPEPKAEPIVDEAADANAIEVKRLKLMLTEEDGLH